MLTTPHLFRTAIAAATVLTGFGLLAIGGCGRDLNAERFPPFQYTATNGEIKTAPVRNLKSSPLERSWDLKLPHPVLRSWISPNLPQLIFFQVRESYEIFAIDALSGSPKWVTQPFTKPPRVPASCSHALMSGTGSNAIYDDRLWIVSDDMLFSFDATYGQIAWRYELPFAPSTGPLGLGPQSNHRVFFGDWDGRIQVTTLNNERGFAYPMWQSNLRATVVAPMVEYDGLVYVADQSGSLHCFKLDRDQGQVWKQDTKAAITGGVAIRDRVLFTGNDDNKIFAFNRLNGDPLGTLFVNGPIRSAPLVFNDEPDRIYVFIDHEDPAIGGLACVRTQADILTVVQPDAEATKKSREIMRLDVMWRIPSVGKLVGSTPLHLFVGSNDPTKRGQIIAINRRFGRVDWTWDCAEEHEVEETRGQRLVAHITEYQDPTDLNRSIFTSDASGRVIAYRMFGDKAGDNSVRSPRSSKTGKVEVLDERALAEAELKSKPRSKPTVAPAPPAAEKAPAAAK